MSDDYVHGFSETEQQRLTRMQQILNEAELRELDLTGVQSILDVGSGLGQMTRALARGAGPGARVIGVERDERQRVEAERQARDAGEEHLIEFRPGDAMKLPLADDEQGAFDLVHTRFLLEHVSDPLAVVQQMVAAARPGGRIVLIDDDHELLRFWPDCPEADRAWRVYWEGYRDRGQDPLVGRRLAGLLHEAGARPVEVRMVFYGAVKDGPLFDLVASNLIGVLDGASGLDAQLKSEATRAFATWREHPAATVWYSLPLAVGEK